MVPQRYISDIIFELLLRLLSLRNILDRTWVAELVPRIAEMDSITVELDYNTLNTMLPREDVIYLVKIASPFHQAEKKKFKIVNKPDIPTVMMKVPLFDSGGYRGPNAARIDRKKSRRKRKTKRRRN